MEFIIFSFLILVLVAVAVRSDPKDPGCKDATDWFQQNKSAFPNLYNFFTFVDGDQAQCTSLGSDIWGFLIIKVDRNTKYYVFVKKDINGLNGYTIKRPLF